MGRTDRLYTTLISRMPGDISKNLWWESLEERSSHAQGVYKDGISESCQTKVQKSKAEGQLKVTLKRSLKMPPAFVCRLCKIPVKFTEDEASKRTSHLLRRHGKVLLWACPECPNRRPVEVRRYRDLKDHLVNRHHGLVAAEAVLVDPGEVEDRTRFVKSGGERRRGSQSSRGSRSSQGSREGRDRSSVSRSEAREQSGGPVVSQAVGRDRSREPAQDPPRLHSTPRPTAALGRAPSLPLSLTPSLTPPADRVVPCSQPQTRPVDLGEPVSLPPHLNEFLYQEEGSAWRDSQRRSPIASPVRSCSCSCSSGDVTFEEVHTFCAGAEGEDREALLNALRRTLVDEAVQEGSPVPQTAEAGSQCHTRSCPPVGGVLISRDVATQVDRRTSVQTTADGGVMLLTPEATITVRGPVSRLAD
jgi:hypothetical protein